MLLLVLIAVTLDLSLLWYKSQSRKPCVYIVVAKEMRISLKATSPPSGNERRQAR